MILIADSGSTKTEWSLCTANGQHSEFYTEGINPFFQSEEDIHRIVSDALLPHVAKYLWAGKLTHIYFYGAGCAFPDKKDTVRNAIARTFKAADIQVESDLLGAARSLFGKEKGVACIMGTGSNSCLYDGCEITKNVSPLGFILGDEGSGAAIGKHLVSDVLKNQLPEHVCRLFLDTYATNAAEILENVYRKPLPNRYLAQFSKFVGDNSQEPALRHLVYADFDAFVTRNLVQYASVETTPIGFVGSVAHHFADILTEVLLAHQLTVGSIAQTPMAGLRRFHKN